MVELSNAQILPQSRLASNGAPCDARHVSLVGISTGVAVGRKLHLSANAKVEWWSLFTTLDQFDTCLTTGPLRFQDPVLFAQVKREFEHVFNHATSRGVDPHESPSN